MPWSECHCGQAEVELHVWHCLEVMLTGSQHRTWSHQGRDSGMVGFTMPTSSCVFARCPISLLRQAPIAHPLCLQAPDGDAADTADDVAAAVDADEEAAAAAPAAAAAAPQEEEEEFSEDDEPNVGQWSPPPLDPKHTAGRDVIPEAEDEALLNLLRKQVCFAFTLHGCCIGRVGWVELLGSSSFSRQVMPEGEGNALWRLLCKKGDCLEFVGMLLLCIRQIMAATSAGVQPANLLVQAADRNWTQSLNVALCFFQGCDLHVCLEQGSMNGGGQLCMRAGCLYDQLLPAGSWGASSASVLLLKHARAAGRRPLCSLPPEQ